MTSKHFREVNVPYTVNPNDESVGRETIVIQRDGEPIAAIVPYAEYQALLARPTHVSPSSTTDLQYHRNRTAFQRLLPELLKEHRGKWVAIVNEQVVVVGASPSAVLDEVYERLGDVPVYVQQMLEKQHVYHLTTRTVI